MSGVMASLDKRCDSYISILLDFAEATPEPIDCLFCFWSIAESSTIIVEQSEFILVHDILIGLSTNALPEFVDVSLETLPDGGIDFFRFFGLADNVECDCWVMSSREMCSRDNESIEASEARELTLV